VSPSDGAVDVTLPVTLQASAFSSGAVGDMHQASTFTLRSGNGVITMIETGGLATVQVPAGKLKPATHYTWSVQYKGTNSPAWSDPSEETTFITVADGQPLLIAYDGSAYAPTPWPVDAHDNNGGFGWVSSWLGGYTAAGFMRVAVDSPGLMYKFPGADEYLAVTNNRFRTDERGKEWSGGSEERILAVSRINRKVGADGGINLLSPSNMYGKAGTTNWFSFLARYEEGDQGARFGIELHSQSVEVVGDAPFYLMFGKPGAVETWGMAAAGGTFVTSGVSAVDGATAFLVARVIYGDPTETAHLWVNPSTRTQPQDANALVLSGVPDFEFNYIGVHAASGSTAPRCGIDELRFGTTWEAVMPLGAPPQPIVGTPTNIAPADASVEVSVTPVIQASVFNGAGAGDTHVATEAKFLSGDGIESLIVTSGLVTFQVPAGALRHSTRYAWSVRYRGSNVPDWSEWSAATTFSTLQGPLQLLAYDGAAYGRATNGIQNFNGGTGWAGVWEGMWWNFDAITYCQTRVNVEAPGLAYTDAGLNSLVNTSNTFITSDFGSYLGTDFDIPGTRSRRTLGHDGALHLLNVSNMFGRVGTTNWFSFLARYESGEPNSYFGIELAGDGTAEKQSSRFVIGKPATASEWGLQAASGASAASTVNALSNSAFLVARLVFGATVSADLWVDPLFEADPPATPSASLTDVAPFEWSRVGIVSHGGAKCALVSIDEVRVGESWQSVTPFVPEPAMLAVCGAALAIAFRRARR